MAEKKARKVKAGPATPVAFVLTLPEDPYAQAQEKAKDPAMTLQGNPFVDTPQVDPAGAKIQDMNMHRLHEDAHLRRKAPHGLVYAGIMQNRFGG